MFKKSEAFLTAVILAAALIFAACNGAENELEHDLFEFESEDYESELIWLVPPTLEYDWTRLCDCGDLVGLGETGEKLIDRETGLLTDIYKGAHGPWGIRKVYDPERNLFGEPGYGECYFSHHIGMQPLYELAERFPWLAERLITVQSVDSSNRFTNEWEAEGNWWLNADAFTGKYAVMYRGEFVTDFIFDGYSANWGIENAETVAMRMGDRWGIIDSNGNIAIPFVFDSIYPIDNRTAFAKYYGRYGILDVRGER